MPGADLEVVIATATATVTTGVVQPVIDSVRLRTTSVAKRVRRRRARAGADLEVTERTAIPALQQAALTDDPIVHEYLAGLIAAASPSDDKVDLLALTSRLTPSQIRLHYDLHRGVIECMDRMEAANQPAAADNQPSNLVYWSRDPNYPPNQRDWPPSAQLAHDRQQIVRLGSFVPALLDDDDFYAEMGSSQHVRDLRQLHREELINLRSTTAGNIGHDTVFSLTPYGIYYFDVGLGVTHNFFGAGYFQRKDQFIRNFPSTKVLDLDPPLPIVAVLPYPVFVSCANEPLGVRDAFDFPTAEHWRQSIDALSRSTIRSADSPAARTQNTNETR
jgi:hypothetical protein